MAAIETVEVYLDADQTAEPDLMGTLHCQRSGKGELFSFKYAKPWLDQAEAFAFDPDITFRPSAKLTLDAFISAATRVRCIAG